jgi:hypothetical protein
MGRLISQEKPDPEREGDKVTKKGSEVKEKNRGQENGKGQLHSLHVKPRREGFPQAMEDYRNGEEEARIKRQFEEREKGLRNGKSNKILMKRGFEIAKQGSGKGVEKDPDEHHGTDHPEEAFPQLAQPFKNSFSVHLSLTRHEV